MVLEVTGRYPGLYTRLGTYNARGDYYTGSLAHNIFFEDVEATAETSAATNNGGSGSRRSLLDGEDKRRVVRYIAPPVIASKGRGVELMRERASHWSHGASFPRCDFGLTATNGCVREKRVILQ